MALNPKYVQRLTQKLRKILKKKGRKLSPKRVHNIRTSMRRIEAVAGAALPEQKNRDKVMLKNVGRIRKQAGKVRDMDVLTADTATLRVPAKSREDLVSLLEYLGSQRYREAKQLRLLLRGKGSRVRKRMKPFSRRVTRQIQNQNLAVRSAEFPTFEASMVRLFFELRRPSRLTARNLHPYRLKIKKLRDAIRLSKDGNISGLAKTLDQAKEAIGDWHDWRQLSSVASEVLGQPKGFLSRVIGNVVRHRYKRALALAHALRRNFLRSKSAAFRNALLRTTKVTAE